MATHPDQSHFQQTPFGSSVVDFVDRWIYVFMAGLFFVTVLVGFIPDSLMKIEMVRAGLRPPFPAILHVHAVTMGAWLCLLLAQTTLMATGRRSAHFQLGLLGMVLMPAIVITGIILVPTMYGQVYGQFVDAPPEMAAQLAPVVELVGNIALLQFTAAIGFPLLVILALRARRNRADIHKRLMILATSIPMPAAIDRITWLPHSMPESALSASLYPQLWLAPMFLWDIYRLRRVHVAYWIYLAVFLPLVVAKEMLWGSDWWLSTVPGLLGQ